MNTSNCGFDEKTFKQSAENEFLNYATNYQQVACMSERRYFGGYNIWQIPNNYLPYKLERKTDSFTNLCSLPTFIEFLKQYIIKNNYVEHVTFHIGAHCEFFEKTISFLHDGTMNGYFHRIIENYLLHLKYKTTTYKQCFQYFVETELMMTDEQFRHIYFCAYPPYVELHKMYETRRVSIVLIHEIINNGFRGQLHCFLDSEIFVKQRTIKNANTVLSLERIRANKNIDYMIVFIFNCVHIV